MIDLDAPTGTSASEPEGHVHATPVETVLISLISIIMVLLPVIEIGLRKLRGQGVPGSSIYVQHFTVWLGFLGALAATEAGKHLGLATANLLAGRWRTRANFFGTLVSAASSMLLTYAAAKV